VWNLHRYIKLRRMRWYLKRMSPPNWPRNRLLLALPAGNLKRLLSQLEPVPCDRGQVLVDADSARKRTTSAADQQCCWTRKSEEAPQALAPDEKGRLGERPPRAAKQEGGEPKGAGEAIEKSSRGESETGKANRANWWSA
jgi:hypothetical protein